MNEPDFFVRFWGVRGSIACGDPGVSRYGGNTSSLEVRCGGKIICLDAGTGIRYLGKRLAAEGGNRDFPVYLTHTHLDHIFGLPFFAPLFNPANRIEVWAGHLLPELTLRRAIEDMMTAPLFPVPPSVFRAEVSYRDFRAGETLAPYPGVVVKTTPLNHPNRATGYRVEYGGKSICYVTDTEHVPGRLDRNVLGLIEGADIAVYDSMYDDARLGGHTGWGHSTWEEALRLADAAKVKTMVLYHHDPDNDDDTLDAMAREAGRRRPGTVVAREGMMLAP